MYKTKMKLSKYRELSMLSKSDTLFFRYTFSTTELPKGKIILKIGRKIGNAVMRNKIKRRIRHIVRESHESDSAIHNDIMLFAQKKIQTADFVTLKQDMLSLLRDINKIDEARHVNDTCAQM